MIKTIYYINYIDTEKTESGSRVRPRMMQMSMEETGCRVECCTGDQTDRTRRVLVRRFRRQLEAGEAICYIESPTYPILRQCDRSLIRTIHRKGIPIGYFYRDFYRKFPMRSGRRSVLRWMKDQVLDFLQWRTDRLLNQCDIIYLPSEPCKSLFHYADMRALPPAGVDHLPEGEKELGTTCIYVGGITGHYDGTLLLDAFQLLSGQDERYRLILVCREAEWEKLDHPCKNAPWLEVHHTYGDGLEPLYSRANAALIALRDVPYNQYAIPVKTFEYMSYGLPVISVNARALSSFIQQEQIGFVVDHDAASLARGIRTLLEEKDTYDRVRSNVYHALRERNLWIHRVRKVIRDLEALEEETDE